MERSLKRPVALHELHRRVHIRKFDNDFVDEQSRMTHEKFENQMTQYPSQTQSITPEEESRVQLSKWVDVVVESTRVECMVLGSFLCATRKGPLTLMLPLLLTPVLGALTLMIWCGGWLLQSVRHLRLKWCRRNCSQRLIRWRNSRVRCRESCQH